MMRPAKTVILTALALVTGACGAVLRQPGPEDAGPVVVADGIPAASTDVAFMRRMMLHHEQALAMTALVPARTSRGDVRLLAERMEVSQRDETGWMRRWLERRGADVPLADAPHEQHATSAEHTAFPGMLTQAELTRLAAATGADFDRFFLELMIRHHQGAVAMVAELLRNPGAARDANVFRFASDVDADQRSEIARMQSMLVAAIPPRAVTTSAADSTGDPRVGLRGGFYDAATAVRNLGTVAHRPRPGGFFNADSLVDFNFANSDIAFRGNHLFLGGYNGFQIWDISNPANPSLRRAFVCPGGQGDVSVHGNLLFVSVQETRGRLDCGTQGVSDSVSSERLRGIRIFDISNLDAPRQVAAVQTCRGSHTHTLVLDPRDSANAYIYVSGTNPPRPEPELRGCVSDTLAVDTSTAYFRIEIIRVPLAAPQDARVVNAPRIFADPSTGAIAGLWRGGAHGAGTQTTSRTDRCHDITAYPELGLAAGACSGNGILLDIRDPVNPVRINEVADPNFAFWHSATFSNEGTKVVFTDEWGGGSAPRCRAGDRREWGANALFELTDRKLRHAGYYKLPAVQADQENCVAHNGSLIPVPGRDIMVQGWYQGGISVFDFTDPANAVEIAYFDRGPVDSDTSTTAGHWSAYWYNGYIYGSEIMRGLDVLRLTPGPNLSANEIRAAEMVRMEEFNAQLQTKFAWAPSFVVARAYLDQLMRNPGTTYPWAAQVMRDLERAESLTGAAQRNATRRLATRLERDAPRSPDPSRVRAMAAVLREMASATR
jgi:uncharacterized protein (DUF305 family)